MNGFVFVLFTLTCGFTASGIVANAYRLMGFNAVTTPGRFLRAAVMVIAGPTVIFDTAIKGHRAKTWRPAWVWLASAGVAYWSLALGLFVQNLIRALAATAP